MLKMDLCKDITGGCLSTLHRKSLNVIALQVDENEHWASKLTLAQEIPSVRLSLLSDVYLKP